MTLCKTLRNACDMICMLTSDPVGVAGDYLKAFCIQLAVLTNHQNGRDTHIRQINVFGPRRDPLRAIGFPLDFTDDAFSCYSTIR